MRSIEAWIATIVRLAPLNYQLAAEVAEARTVLKGYGDTRRRGQARYDRLMALVLTLADDPAGATAFARLRKAALADEEGIALERALAELQRPAEPARTAAE